MEKVIVFGIGNEFKRWYNILDGMDKYILYCIDSNNKQKSVYGHKILQPDILRQTKENIVIMATENNSKEICSILRRDIGVDENRIIPLKKWLGIILENDHVKINPSCVNIDASTICQLNCMDCYMRKENNGALGAGYLSYDHYKRFLSNNPQIRNVELANNGESLLNPSFPEILRESYERGVVVSLRSGCNFNNVNEPVLESLVKYKVDAITISIDGASEDVYKIYRRGGSYSQVISNIERLNSIKKEYSSDKPSLSWQFVLMNHNEVDIENAKKMSEKLGMRIVYKLDWSGQYQPADPERVGRITGLDVFNRVDYAARNKKPYKDNICEQMIFRPSINWDGKLLGCCNLFRKTWEINCFENHSLFEAVNSKEYKESIARILQGERVSENSACNLCDYYHKYIVMDGQGRG